MSTGRSRLLSSVTPQTARSRRRAAIDFVAVAIAAALVLGSPGVARADRIDDFTQALETSKDQKARINAAVQLGNLGDARGVPALIRALDDPSVVVRGVAASALGHIGDLRAIVPLENALSDSSEAVRQRARDALKALRAKQKTDATPIKPATTETTTTTTTTRTPPVKFTPRTIKPTDDTTGGKPRIYVVVKQMGNKTAQGGKDLAKRMRETVVGELERASDLTLDSNVGSKLKQFVIDGSISKVTRGTSGPWVEVTCEVKLTVSTAEGRLLSIVTGSATVQMPRGSFKTSMERNMQVEAVENAVRGAQQNLHGFLTKQVAQK
jgi:hypothetical protein